MKGICELHTSLHRLLLHPRFNRTLHLTAAPLLQKVAAKSGILCAPRQFRRNCIYLHHVWRLLHSFQGQLGSGPRGKVFYKESVGHHQSNQRW